MRMSWKQVTAGWCTRLAVVVALAAGESAAAPVVAGFERFARGSDDPVAEVEGGLLLLGELGCVNCHAPGDAASRHVGGRSGPILDRVGERIDPAWLARYLADPPAVRPAGTMPHVLAGLEGAERTRVATALTHYLAGSGVFWGLQVGDMVRGMLADEVDRNADAERLRRCLAATRVPVGGVVRAGWEMLAGAAA